MTIINCKIDKLKVQDMKIAKSHNKMEGFVL